MVKRRVVLVVEDHVLARYDAVDMIEKAGFATMEAATAEQALTLLATYDEIGAVFTDIEMPSDGEGLRLADIVRTCWPGVGVILTSGRIRPTPATLPPNTPFLQKPVQAAELIGHLHRLMPEAGED
jgi:CheY-like chemotaxis protein